MKFYADLHIHSRYSRATSRDLSLESLSAWAQLKGIQVVGTGDCVHPAWLRECREKLAETPDGLLALKKSRPDGAVPAACAGPVRFALTTEISNIYKKSGRVRKVHNLVVLPGFEAAEKLQARLGAIGNIRSDGRPILGLDSRDLLEIVLELGRGAFLVPAHIWTPWFSVLGSKSGFDSIAECYGDLAEHIFAVETGLSSDPPMNRRLSSLDPYVLVSNSDAHSASKLGREATVFDTELSYEAMYRALADRHDRGLVGTVEFFPEEGKYHYDGHRACGMRMTPEETRAGGGRCPACGKPVTVGVMSRVMELADRPSGECHTGGQSYFTCIPLKEIIAETEMCGPNTKKVRRLYDTILSNAGSELHVLQNAPVEEIERAGGRLVAEGIRRMRRGKVTIAAGYDGEFGTVRLFEEKEVRDRAA